MNQYDFKICPNFYTLPQIIATFEMCLTFAHCNNSKFDLYDVAYCNKTVNGNYLNPYLAIQL